MKPEDALTQKSDLRANVERHKQRGAEYKIKATKNGYLIFVKRNDCKIIQSEKEIYDKSGNFIRLGIKLRRIVNRQCYLLGAYAETDMYGHPAACQQVKANIEKFGFWHIFKCYYYNSGIFYWLRKKDRNFASVIKRILDL